jgi:NAD(P)H-dependent FMN reductase
MITIISGTNRKGNRTIQIVTYYRDALVAMGENPKVLLPEGIDLNRRTPELERLENEVLIPSEKFVFILPEYNGSFPGAIKTLIDLCRVRECFFGKKALLTGVADGRAGNLRGMEHFTGILNHMHVVVHPNRLPISMVKSLVNERGELTDEATRRVIDEQLREFVAF